MKFMTIFSYNKDIVRTLSTLLKAILNLVGSLINDSIMKSTKAFAIKVTVEQFRLKITHNTEIF